METIQLAENSFVDIYRNWCDGSKLFETLRSEIQWEQKTIRLYGKEVLQPRLVAWYGSEAYTYSGKRNNPKPLTYTLWDLMEKVEDAVGAWYNSVLCNLYRDGQDSIGMHSDDEPELGWQPRIASLSLGSSRRFELSPKAGGAKTILTLNSGDLLVMSGETQKTHKHGVPKTKLSEPRINLTFRRILPV